MRSPMVVARASIAVTAVVPNRIAIPASILRRRCRRKLSMSRRKNISDPSPLEDRSQLAEIRSLNHHVATLYGRLQWDGVAAALLAHRRGVEGRGAHLAGDALIADVEAHRSADLAGVGDRDDGAVGLFEEKKADLKIAALAVVEVDAVAVKLVVVDLGGR